MSNSNAPHAASTSVEPLFARIVDLLAHIADTVGVWHARYRQRRQLAALPPGMLKDLGIHAADAGREAAKPFWRA